MSDTKKDKMTAALEANLPVVAKPPVEKKADDVEDYEYSRRKYREMIDKSSEAIERAMQLAQESDHPRAFEVLANMLKSTTDMVDKLMELQHTKEDLAVKKADEKKNAQKQLPPGTTITQNNTFVGSPAELQRMLKTQNEQPINV